MLGGLVWRMTTEISPRLLWKAGRLWAWRGGRTVAAHRRRLARGELFPPFWFVDLTDACNLRCKGCWVPKDGPEHRLPREDLDALIESGKRRGAYFYTLLGGEPLKYDGLCEIFEEHRDCYFQIITNGTLFNEENIGRLRRAGNVTPLVSVDGLREHNDARRGAGVFEQVVDGLKLLRKHKLLFGVAVTVTAPALEEVVSDEFVRRFIKAGALYLWYYVYRPVGVEPHPELGLSREMILKLRRRLVSMRRRHPLVIIDSYWDAAGTAFCPAAAGLGFHVGPRGSLEICPPLSFAVERIQDNGGDLFKTVNESEFLRGFQRFVAERTNGCVILEYPQELERYLREAGAREYGDGNGFAELAALSPRSSHYLPGDEIPEEYWLYRFLKKRMFFGMSAYG